MIKISDTEYFSNDGTIRFLQMDCNEFMKGLKENEFDLNLSDPPYGINAGKMTMGSGKHKFTKDKKWDEFVPSDECFNKIIETSANQIIFGGNYFRLPLNNNWIIWDKLNPNLSFSEAELAWCSINRNVRIYKRYSAMEDNDGKKQHPTQKPIDLYRWILQNYTKPTDTILDCFGGSMSNAIACHMERRKLTIIELDVDYFKSALNRFDMYERQLTLF